MHFHFSNATISMMGKDGMKFTIENFTGTLLVNPEAVVCSNDNNPESLVIKMNERATAAALVELPSSPVNAPANIPPEAASPNLLVESDDTDTDGDDSRSESDTSDIVTALKDLNVVEQTSNTLNGAIVHFHDDNDVEEDFELSQQVWY